jgi:steroid delta-isomerase-like uncharacterized protein
VGIEENKQVVHRWTELWNDRGADGVDEVFAPEFQDEQLAAHLGQPVSLELLKESLQALSKVMGNPQFEEHEMVAEADQVLVRWTVRGIHEGTIWGAPPTGKPFAIEGANVFRVRDGKIVERRSFLDPTGVLALLSD